MTLRKAVWLGGISGLRSMAGIAALVNHAQRNPLEAQQYPEILRSSAAAAVLRVAQVGETIGDKLPFTPSRLTLFPLFGRIMVGAVVGALAHREDRLKGGMYGASAALIGSYLGNRIRRQLVDETGIPDPLIALFEDAVAITAAESIVNE